MGLAFEDLYRYISLGGNPFFLPLGPAAIVFFFIIGLTFSALVVKFILSFGIVYPSSLPAYAYIAV